MITEGEAGAGVSAGGAQMHDRTRWSRECGVVGLGRDLSLKTARAPAALSARYNPHRAGARTGPHRFVRYGSAARSEREAGGARAPRVQRASPEAAETRRGSLPLRTRRAPTPERASVIVRTAGNHNGNNNSAAPRGSIYFRFCAVCRRKYRTKKPPQPDVCTGGGATWRGGIRSCGPDPWPCGRPVVPHRILVSG